MTDAQLVTIAVTLLAIFIAMQVNNHRMTDLRTDVGLRITELGTRFDQRFVDVDRRFSEVDKRFEQFEKRFEQIDQRFSQIDQRFAQIDQRFAQVDQRFIDTNRHIDDKFNLLAAQMRADRAETNGKLDSILAFMANIDQRVTRLEERNN
jgi:hypothetical protein